MRKTLFFKFYLISILLLTSIISFSGCGMTDNMYLIFEERFIPLSLSNITIESNNINKFMAKENDTVSLSFVTNKAAMTPTVTISGNSTILFGGPTSWTTSHIMTAGDPEGLVAFEISNLVDTNGDVLPNINSVTDSSFVIYDRTDPSLTSVSIYSNNPDPTRAKVGDEITVSFTSSETIVTPSAVIAGNGSVISGGPTNWQAKYIMTAGDTEGLIPFVISGIIDPTGNTSPDVASVTDGSSVTFDKTAPVVTLVSISSNNADPTKAKVGDIVTISFSSNEALLTPSATIAGNGASISNGPLNWTASYTMTTSDPEGLVSFILSNLKDLAGNSIADISSVTDGTSVDFNKTTAAITPVSIASNNADPSKAKVGDTITVSFTSSEDIATPTMTIAGNSVPVLGGPKIWTATYVMTGTDPEGPVSFLISNIADLYGNPVSDISSTTDGTSVLFDKTAPFLTEVYISSNNSDITKAKVGDEISISFTSSETIISPSANIAGNGATIIGGPTLWQANYTMTAADLEGVILFSISGIIDPAGNTCSNVTSTTDASSVTFDKTAPVVTVVSISSSNADPSKAKVGDIVTISFSSNEALLIPSATISGNGASISNGPLNWTGSYTMTASDPEGMVSFILSNLKDLAGNSIVNISSVTDGSNVDFDKTAPVISPVSIVSNNPDPTLAKIGNIITLTFSSSEDIVLPIVTVAGNPVIISGGPAIWTADYIMTGTDPEGIVGFIISGVSDFYGNTTPNVTGTTDGTSVLFDRTDPSLTSVSIYSNNPDPTRAKVGNTITVDFTSSEQILTPSATISGSGALISGGPINWTATYIMTGTDPEGPVSFNITDLSDLSGNTIADIFSVTDGSSVIFDRTIPSVISVSIASNNPDPTLAKVGDTITVTFVLDEAMLTPSCTIVGNTASISGGPSSWTASHTMTSGDPEGNITFNISDLSDLADNAIGNVIFVTDGSSVNFDKTAPVISPISISSDNVNPTRAKVGDTITLDFTISEVLQATPTVTLLGKTATVSGGPFVWSASYTAGSTDPQGTVAINITGVSDLAGNTSSASSTTDGSSVIFDRTPPSLSVSISSNFADPTYAYVGSKITLSVTSNEAIATPVVTIMGTSVTVSGGPTVWSASYTTQATDTTAYVTFDISGIVDITGNTSSPVTSTTNGSFVLFENYEAQWSAKKTINIDGQTIGLGGNVNNYPMLIRLSTTNFPEINGSTLANGKDIRFAKTDGTALHYEIDDWANNSNGRVWVLIPSVSRTAPTQIWMYYDNPGALANISKSEYVFNTSNGFQGVWHLNEIVTDEQTSGTHFDGTFNANDGSQYRNDDATGIISRSQHFDGNDYINAGSDASLKISSRITLSSWVRLSSDPGNNDFYSILGKQNTYYNMYAWGESNTLTSVAFDFELNTGGADRCGHKVDMPNNVWTFLAITFDGSTFRSYVNGQQVFSLAKSGTIRTSNSPLIIGGDTADDFHGRLDEARVSSVTRNANWVKLDYQSQKASPTIVTIF